MSPCSDSVHRCVNLRQFIMIYLGLVGESVFVELNRN